MDSAFEVSTDRDRLDLDVICGFLQTSYWAKQRRRSVIERAVRHSLCFGGYFEGRQVAFARVVTDRATFAYLADVFVLPEFRGRGYSKAIMAAVAAHPDLQHLRLFMLMTRDAHQLYSQFRFKALTNPDWLMAIQDPDSDAHAV